MSAEWKQNPLTDWTILQGRIFVMRSKGRDQYDLSLRAPYGLTIIETNSANIYSHQNIGG